MNANLFLAGTLLVGENLYKIEMNFEGVEGTLEVCQITEQGHKCQEIATVSNGGVLSIQEPFVLERNKKACSVLNYVYNLLSELVANVGVNDNNSEGL